MLKRSVVLWVKEATKWAWPGSSPPRGPNTVSRTPFPAALSMSASRWYSKWNDRAPTPRRRRREQLTAAIGKEFEDSGAAYGSPRIGLELREKGWRVSDNTIAAIMAEKGWVARKVKRRSATTRQGK
ncbi:transposase, partial [Nocardia amamiensis]